jgi:hypothetical protein
MEEGQRPDLGFADIGILASGCQFVRRISRDGIADSTSHLYGLGDHDLLFELPISGGKAPNQKRDGGLVHQDSSRATLHTNQLCVVSLTT